MAVDSPEGRLIVGVPCVLAVTEGASPTFAFELLLRDPNESDTLFDGLDFAALDSDGDGEVVLSEAATPDAYNLLRRTLQTHDHFNFAGK